MGVEKFFSSLKKKYTNKNENFIKLYKDPLICNHILIDFNSIVHVISQYMLHDDKYDMNTFELILIENVGIYIEDLISNYIIINDINSIYICVDGVPTMSKIYEQKKRRYMGDFLNNINKLQNKDSDKKFTWSRNNISPGTDFMKEMIKRLKSEDYIMRIKKKCVNIKEYIVSGVDMEGEGEFKIVQIIDKLNSNKLNNNIIVYSPDSDVILLLLLSAIKNPTFRITMLRYDMQQSTSYVPSYDVIDINLFQSILINYIQNKIKTIDTNKIIDNNNIIADIVFILTIFGDDFLPKLETVRVSMDISIILDFYALILTKYNYILTKENNIYKINTNSLLEYFKIICIQEDYFIKRNAKHHIISQYHKNDKLILGDSLYKLRDLATNYIWKFIYINKMPDIMISPLNVKSIIPVEKFINFIENKEVNIKKDVLNRFINMNMNSSSIYNCYDAMLHLVKYNFIEILQNINNNIVLNTPENILESILVYFYTYYKLPFDDIGIEPYYITLHQNTFNSTDKNHRYRIKQMDKSQINNYLIENKLDMYYSIFNPIDNFYKNVYQHIESNVDYSFYYTEHFHNMRKDTIVKKYMEGLNFVLNYYHNHIVDKYWYYPYSRSPMLSDIIKYFREHDFTYNNKNKNNNNFLTPLEHYLFVTPFHINNIDVDQFNMIYKNNKKNIDNIILFIKENTQYFFDLDEIYKNKNNMKIIDCSGSHFISKCHLIYLEKNIDIKQFIIDIRKYF